MNKSIVFIALLFLSVAVISCKNTENKTDDAKKDSLNTTTTAPKDSTVHSAKYVCPMHPEETSDKPGKCPKCGMDFELKS